MVIGILSQWYRSWGMKMTSHCQLMPTITMRRNVPVVPLYAFMALTHKNLSFYHTVVANTYM
jgi:hypothetical protein